ncbi:MAG: Zn-ribbon domain-containing OB-fold protein [Acidilobaceae archaeon]|nr:Zn-ribbon domain-containing OB-fold protein [Acidilobaceae archaeon]MCX8165050.1 Zn-ribbon domain-containing OB-fold protein [Acidilobaceae archaeon]MDW7974433.1 Zn-ribbon domain-containing OB-fold protein [Sulfolobales archaeon]
MGIPGRYVKEEELKRMAGVIEYKPTAKYAYSAGQALSVFLKGLREGKIVGRTCNSCRRIMVPPREFCEYCHSPAGEWVELPGTGRVETASVSYISARRAKLREPEVVAIIRLDAPGYRGDEPDFPGIFHRLCGVTEEEVKGGKVFGARVRPRWRPEGERRGSITDIECFERW